MKSSQKYINDAKQLFLIFMISFSIFYGCNEDDASVNLSASNNLSLSAISMSDSSGDSQSILILDSVKILVRDLKLNVAEGNQELNNFKTGPFVIYLNTFFEINEIGSEIIPVGIYDKVKFEIHKLNNNENTPDLEFKDANGTYSLIIKGRYNGSQFIYKSSKSAHQILQFQSSLIVSSDITNITLLVKPYIWFIKNGVYLDPEDPSNSNDIDNNIKNNINNNFRICIDNDKNGIPDGLN